LSKRIGLAVATAILLSGTAHADQLVVMGNNRVAKDFILAQFPKDGTDTADEIDAGVKALYETGQFTEVKVSRLKTGVSVIAVTEAALVGVVDFSGNKRLKDAQIEHLIGLKSGAPITKAAIEVDRKAILEAYAKTGRNDARITVKTAENSGRTNIQFVVDEGRKSKISKIYFTGNDHVNAIQLRGAISTKESGLVTSALNKDVYDVDQVDRDREQIIEYYQSKGYADVQVGDADVTFDSDTLETMIGFEIKEGQLYQVKNVFVDSTIQSYSGGDRKKDYGASGYYDPSEVSRLGKVIEREVSDKVSGSTDLKVSTNRNFDGTMDVVYTVDPARNVYIERIDITGNTQTKEYVIRRELDFAEGDRIDTRQIREAERRLKALGFFQSVQIKSVQASSEDRATMVIEVVEQKTGEFSLGAGYSSSEGVLATAGISQSNFMGTGRGLAFEVGRGEDSDNYFFSYSEPHLLGYRATGFVELYHRNTGFDNDRFHPFDETRTGGRIGVRAPVTDDLTGSLYYGLFDRLITDVPADYQGIQTAALPFLIEDGNSVVSFLGYDLTYNTLNDPTAPSDGVYANFNQEFAGIGGDTAWVKSEGKFTVYTDILPREDLVGSLGLKAGNITAIGQDLAFVDHFRNDSNLVRGFQRGGFGPRDAATGYSVGGQFYLGGTAETSMPLPFIPESFGVKGVLFVDAGSVFNPDKSSIRRSGSNVLSEDFSIRAATGAGIAWHSPVGLIKANVAMPIAKEEGDEIQWFSFSAGSRF
jgi:outer membrane protein insertion porin family